MVWFPELFNRYEIYENDNPGKSASVCDVTKIKEEPNEQCDSSIKTSVFVNTLILGCACIPTSLWLPLCVHRLGIKFFLSMYFYVSDINYK